jgi:hypothetical protein
MSIWGKNSEFYADLRSEGIVRNNAKRPEKKCTLIAPSHGLFLTCRGEKYTEVIYVVLYEYND